MLLIFSHASLVQQRMCWLLTHPHLNLTDQILWRKLPSMSVFFYNLKLCWASGLAGVTRVKHAIFFRVFNGAIHFFTVVGVWRFPLRGYIIILVGFSQRWIENEFLFGGKILVNLGSSYNGEDSWTAKIWHVVQFSITIVCRTTSEQDSLGLCSRRS